MSDLGSEQTSGLRSPATKRGLQLALVVLILDVVTKQWALEVLFSRSIRIEVLPFLNFTPVWNRGVSFGLFASDSPYTPWILSAFAIAVTVALFVWLTKSKGWSATYGLGLIIGGAVGNVLDRVRFGKVVDFIDVHWHSMHWPAFNVADSAITIGVCLLFLDAFGIGCGASSQKQDRSPGE